MLAMRWQIQSVTVNPRKERKPGIQEKEGRSHECTQTNDTNRKKGDKYSQRVMVIVREKGGEKGREGWERECVSS